MTTTIAPYGTWVSPITSDSIVQDSVTLGAVIVDPITSVIYHLEGRPSEGGRSVIVETDQARDVFGAEWNATSLVQSYGGGAAIAYDGVVYFSNLPDCRVYELSFGGEPTPITPDNPVHRFSDFCVNPAYPFLIVAILEDHTHPAPSDVVTTLCVINTKTKTVSPLVSGADFYAAPRFSPDGKHFAWQQWHLDDMPWEGGEIYVAAVDVADDAQISLRDTVFVGGKKNEVSAGYPTWASKDTFFFTSDISGYQNPWSYSLASNKAAPILLQPVNENFSDAAWTLGRAYGDFIDSDGSTLLFTASREGRAFLYLVSIKSGTLKALDLTYAQVREVRRVATGSVVFAAQTIDGPPTIVLLTLAGSSDPSFKVIKSFGDTIDRKLFSVPRSITLQVSHDEPLYVTYFAPTNPDYVGPDGEKPPCVLNVHGGPTSNESQALSWTKQYFTSRGWAWLDVNYRGSLGYGRKYVEKLAGKWGILDIDDCVFAAQELSKSLVDTQRLFIRGGSSGGFTVLAALCIAPEVFAGATSYYGISDLTKLVEDTHKFESKYMNKLLGGSITEIPEVYYERSPVNNADKIKSPLLILQGSEDTVVPPSQSDIIVKSIEDRQGTVKYIVFDGEGHGFKKAGNIKTALEEELVWYENLIGVSRPNA